MNEVFHTKLQKNERVFPLSLQKNEGVSKNYIILFFSFLIDYCLSYVGKIRLGDAEIGGYIF